MRLGISQKWRLKKLINISWWYFLFLFNEILGEGDEDDDPVDDPNYPAQYIDEDDNVYILTNTKFDPDGPFGIYERESWEWLWFESDCLFLEEKTLVRIIHDNLNYCFIGFVIKLANNVYYFSRNYNHFFRGSTL